MSRKDKWWDWLTWSSKEEGAIVTCCFYYFVSSHEDYSRFERQEFQEGCCSSFICILNSKLPYVYLHTGVCGRGCQNSHWEPWHERNAACFSLALKFWVIILFLSHSECSYIVSHPHFKFQHPSSPKILFIGIYICIYIDICTTYVYVHIQHFFTHLF